MQCNSLHFDTLKLQMLCHRNGLVSRDSNSTPVCQYKQGPLTLRAICPIQERRWRCHPILRGGGASEKAGEGGPGGNGPAPRRHARGREVFTFNYGSKRVLTQSMYRGRESTAREGDPPEGINAIPASSKPQLTAGSHHSFNARPSASANGLNAMSDEAFSYPMCCLSILNHRVPSPSPPA